MNKFKKIISTLGLLSLIVVVAGVQSASAALTLNATTVSGDGLLTLVGVGTGTTSATAGIGLTANTSSTIVIGGPAQTGVIDIADPASSAVSTINIGTNAQANVISIGTATTTASVTVYGQKQPVIAVTGARTLLVSESGSTVTLATAPVILLPSVSTASGVWYRFFVAADVTTDGTITTGNTHENVIEGTLEVAGAVIDCDAEDVITVVADGENVGDFFELHSNGTKWFIGASGALTTAKMTCSTT